METDTGKTGLTLIEMAFEVTGLPVAQTRPEVS